MTNKFLIIDNDYSRISGSTKFIHDELDKIINTINPKKANWESLTDSHH